MRAAREFDSVAEVCAVTLNVPGDYLTIAAAADAASEGDTIQVAAGYSGHENVNLTVDHLTFDIAAGVPTIVLTSANNVSAIFCNGYGPVRSSRIGDTGNNSLDETVRLPEA